ncbi:YlbL family protein [Nocardioides bizhenqiangii]|uniref:S16 family serine protease n=1 Tax=Nocardioides bizhenqiangii TaxID=3095076 RepID=A0ABZ0ZM38_9ACTN|nr:MULTISPECIES: S16 family serine protease [unclassified Nocardioides]MDZ5621147.1 S16 family serine protease [Nocardioides sp. HM23]WQQ25408.1 S16 family serine protease [Nocardioides sp. HM61]
MTQRWIAFAFAAPLTLLLLVLAAFVPLPYSVYSPGPTFDVLAKDGNESEIIQVDGHETFRDDGEIRFTTVQTSGRDDKKSLVEALAAWIDGDQAVIPYDIAHPPDQTAEDERRQGAVSMVGSQDTAVATALRELDYEVPTALQVAFVEEDGAAFGELRVRDKLLEIDGEPLDATGEKDVAQQLVDGIQRHGPGDPVELLVERGDTKLTVEIEPREVDGQMRIGITPGLGYDFPFDVSIRVDDSIGGPSAGLMFSLAIYDTLTPGSLTDGEIIAGTGELADDGSVGAIGGIQQKIAGAEDADAELFFVPADNCPDVAGLDTDLTLVKATTMPQALEDLEAWAADRDADLPSC